MSRSVNFIAELQSLEADIKDLEQAQESLPCGAHIHALFQLAIERVEVRIIAVQRVRAVACEQFRLGRDAAA